MKPVGGTQIPHHHGTVRCWDSGPEAEREGQTHARLSVPILCCVLLTA
jgi:hypothetical protein